MTVVYIGTVAFSSHYLDRNPETPFRIHIAIWHCLAFSLFGAVTLRSMLEADEMEHKIQFTGMAITWAVTIIATVCYSLLEMVGKIGLPEVNLFFIGTGMIGLWGIVVPIVRWRMGLPLFGCR
jgi:hypothetical protein